MIYVYVFEVQKSKSKNIFIQIYNLLYVGPHQLGEQRGEEGHDKL